MDEKRRTLTFTVVALVSLGAAVVTHLATRPRLHVEFELVGQEFFPDFTDPNEAQSLRVAAFDEDTATFNEFNVEFKDGLWRIPSHHDYPADAEDRLAETAASVIGIKRGGLVSRRKSEHVRYGVFDTLSEDAAVLQGRGQRITLKKGDGTMLADYIIGKESEEVDGFHYVRVPNEEETYVAELNIDLSTKFSDWIEADLLKVDRDSITKIVIDKYSIDEARGRVVAGEQSALTRKSWSDPWTLEGLDEEHEELKTDEIREMVNDLDDLKIVGVRPKPPGLKPDLSIDQNVIKSSLELNAVVADMMSKGFFITQDQKLVSNEGEVQAATKNGVVYALHFGEIFSGSGLEIEVGFTKDKQQDKQKESSTDDGEQADGEEGEEHAGSDSTDSPSNEKTENEDDTDAGQQDNLKRNRYLFITASFDPEPIGERPEKPLEPQKPNQLLSEKTDPAAGEAGDAGVAGNGAPDFDGSSTQPGQDESSDEKFQEEAQDAEGGAESGENPGSADNSAEDAPPASGETKDDGSSAGESDESDSGEEKQAGEEKKEEQKDPEAEYAQALQKYKQDLEKYENDLSDYEDKLKQGREKVDELNERFGAWYYVISAESFENLRLSRQDLVKPKEAEDKQDESKQDETKQDESKQDETKSDETQPDETKSAENNERESTPETGEESGS